MRVLTVILLFIGCGTVSTAQEVHRFKSLADLDLDDYDLENALYDKSFIWMDGEEFVFANASVLAADSSGLYLGNSPYLFFEEDESTKVWYVPAKRLAGVVELTEGGSFGSGFRIGAYTGIGLVLGIAIYQIVAGNIENQREEEDLVRGVMILSIFLGTSFGAIGGTITALKSNTSITWIHGSRQAYLHELHWLQDAAVYKEGLPEEFRRLLN